ncbi:MAG TPA: hypothetical protein PLT36_05595 [Erysipelotrichaceae bacterium]|jgi:hypothetical protein|nr:hypothetical protein [Erysipelotrichia bacterium]HPX32960.1 hypothetical protein [Erysipelotrichaceae bacterium]HQA85492.1 hypothetical protein [Erysipelotrichaceae bacterium]
MLKKLIGTAIVGAVITAIGVKVIKDILHANEEEKNIIDLEKDAGSKCEEPCEEKVEEE